MFEQLVREARKKYPAANWVDASTDKAQYVGLRGRVLHLNAVRNHMRLHGAGTAPAREGQPANLPPAMGPLLAAKIGMDQVLGKTGGQSKATTVQQMRDMIQGSPFEDWFTEASSFRRGFETWLKTQGGGVTRSGVTSAAETDVTRLIWMRWSVITLHMMGVFEELIRLGWMESTPHLLCT